MKKRKLTKKGNITIVSVIAMLFLAVIVLHENQFADPHQELIKKCIAVAIILVSLLLYALLYDKIVVLPAELYQNRRLIWKLAKNDFKTRFAGSYLGIVWAFVQPVVAILVYWIVFEKGLNAKAEMLADGTEAPYVLWLTAGIVPWFYFSEALSNGTTALLEYNYLVKKVVFKISILPIIKIIAATFIHGFFVLFMLLLYMAHGYFPDAYTLQLFYFSFCLFIFVLGISYTTCAIVIFSVI